MITKRHKCVEPLYLKVNGIRDIYIPENHAVKLMQYQREGIRFLYKHFEKRAQGVILNDPPGYGKRVQTVLFLNAMLTHLSLPVLILCNDTNIGIWKNHFNLYTDCSEDVAFELTNVPSKKKIFITTSTNFALFSKREWSLIVVNNNDCANNAKLNNLDASYKIWIASDNLKIDLKRLSFIYEWIKKPLKFNYECTSNDVFQNHLSLEIFLEDVLLRHSDLEPAFHENKINSETSNILKKNKDITGTKVKSSKKRKLLTDNTIDNIKMKPTVTNASASLDIFTSNECMGTVHPISKELIASNCIELNKGTKANKNKEPVRILDNDKIIVEDCEMVPLRYEEENSHLEDQIGLHAEKHNDLDIDKLISNTKIIQVLLRYEDEMKTSQINDQPESNSEKDINNSSIEEFIQNTKPIEIMETLHYDNEEVEISQFNDQFKPNSEKDTNNTDVEDLIQNTKPLEEMMPLRYDEDEVEKSQLDDQFKSNSEKNSNNTDVEEFIQNTKPIEEMTPLRYDEDEEEKSQLNDQLKPNSEKDTNNANVEEFLSKAKPVENDIFDEILKDQNCNTSAMYSKVLSEYF